VAWPSTPQHLFVTNQASTSVTEYAPGASGNATPVATIAGPNTGLDEAAGVAIDPSGNLFVTNVSGNSVTEYAPGAGGNAIPLATIEGSDTGLDGPFGIAVAATPQYSSTGFVAPINNAPLINTGKAGRTYPVKFQVTDAQGQLVSDLAAVASISYTSTSCTAFGSDESDALDTTATGGAGLRYDTSSNQFVYN
jgi:hypothetical protein